MCDHCGCREFRPIAELSMEHEQILEAAWELSEQHRATGRAEPPGDPERPAEPTGEH